MPRRTLLIIFLTAIVSYACYRTAHQNRYARYFSEIMQAVDENYVEPVDDEQLYEGAIGGMIGQLDSFSHYIDRRQTKPFQELVIDQRFDGIGIEVAIDPKTKQLKVTTPIVGTPAYLAGIQAGDRITKIDGRPTAGVGFADLRGQLRGPSGSSVTLEIEREGEATPRVVEVERRQIKVDTVLGDTRKADDTWNFWLPGHDRIGYVRLTSFGDRTAKELAAALAKLSGSAGDDGGASQGMRGLILDLRDNPGGLLDSAAEVAGLFLNQGDLLVTIRGKGNKERERLVVGEPGPYRQVPLVVLVNHDSASAAEIVAAALADDERATLVGERTYGKGTVQTMIPVEGGRSMLKLTTATYWRPNGQNIHRLDHRRPDGEWGVTPDEANQVEMSKQDYAAWQEDRRQRDIVGAKTAAGAAHGRAAGRSAVGQSGRDSPAEDRRRVTDRLVSASDRLRTGGGCHTIV